MSDPKRLFPMDDELGGLLDEPITPAILVGSAVVVVAVALVTSARVAAPVPVTTVVDPMDAPA